MPTDSRPLLAARGLGKRFGGVRALGCVDFEVRPGEVHALMGQNGAGKSTLVKLLTGALGQDAGTMELAGSSYHPGSPADAERVGVRAIYQELALVESLSVAENLFLGRAPRRWYGIDWRRMNRMARDLLRGYGLEIEVAGRLGGCSAAVQQLVAVARAAGGDAKVLFMDEPSSSLDKPETAVLFDLVRRLKERGLGIVFVTHFLDQAYEISDRITVLRNGERIGTYEAAGLPKDQLVSLMLGRSADRGEPAGTKEPQPRVEGPLVEIRGLFRKGRLEPLDLEVGRGEVVGFAGLLGSGRTEAARLVFGADRPEGGTVRIGGVAVPAGSCRESIERGMAFLPEERKTQGIFPGMSLVSNIAVVVQRRLSRFGLVSRKSHERVALGLIQALGIVASSLDRPIDELSGGNQQKALVARWLASRPVFFILDEPTRGIDVGAKAEMERILDRLAREGMAVLFISSELEEVLRRAHRILVLRDRRPVGVLSGANRTMEEVMGRIAGGRATGA